VVPEHKRASALAWKIRTFRPPDEPTIAEILRDSSEAAQWSPESHTKLASSPGSVFLVCEANAKPVGFVAGRQLGDEGEILNIAVRPDYRRKGIASALLMAALDEFRRSAIARIFLELRESNLPARALYERHGFLPAGRRKGYYLHPAEDAICMRKEPTSD
jgi:ribosomal-protein-alanine N-acetyltransferase